jgi:two-component system, LuxR family, sensor kinase FixL
MKVDASTESDCENPEPVRPAAGTSEAWMHALLDAAVDGILTIDEQGIIQTINRSAEQLFGYAAAEVIGQNVKILMPPPFSYEHDGYLGHYSATGEKKIIGIGREVVGLRKNGSTFPMDLSVAEARVGKEKGFIGIVRDITERKRTEAELSRLAAIVESSDDAIISKNLDGTIVTWNAGAEQMFGYSAGEVLGRHISILAPPDSSCELSAILEKIRRGERVDHFETVRVRKDGRRIDVSVTISPVRSATGQILGAAAIKRDITLQKRATEEVRTMTQQLWQAAKLASVGELAASIAHELNNPLATVTLRVESVLRRTPEDDPRRKALEIVEQESRRMGDLVANLLQFSRKADGQISTVDIRQELSKAVDLVQHVFRKRLIDVVQDATSNTPTIFADRQKLRQVFLNLLTNAGDAMPQGGTLTLRTAAITTDNGNPAVLIELADTGTGISAGNLDRIMEPFFTTKEEGKGTGLGLAICRRIVQEHQGTMQVFSELGKGTTVRLVLPLKNGGNVDRVRGAGFAN